MLMRKPELVLGVASQDYHSHIFMDKSLQIYLNILLTHNKSTFKVFDVLGFS